MEKLPISVIVITRNAEGTIDECLSAIKKNNPAEIVVVDGNSTDRTGEIARRYTKHVCTDEGRGKSYARQLGAEMATQEYVTYVDADIVLLTDSALATMLAEFRSSDYVHIAAQLVPGMECSTYWGWARYQHDLLHQVPAGRGGGVALASGMFRRETVLHYGFDLAYGGHMDDIGLELKLRRDGHIFGTSSAQVYHRSRVNLKQLVRYQFFLGRVAFYCVRRYGIWHANFWPPLGMLYWLGICLIKGELKLIPYEILDGVVKTAGMVKGFFELLIKTKS